MASWEEFSRIVLEAKAAKKLDPVGHEDDDVDNDGDVDSSDSYLKKRRSAVGAAIAADRKKKVEESKHLDPVGQEDEDIDNDGDHDESDKYLLNRRKVRSKIIAPKERLKTDRDMFNIPKSEQEAAKERLLAKTKAKRMKEEVQQLDEIPAALAIPLAIGGVAAAGRAIGGAMDRFVNKQQKNPNRRLVTGGTVGDLNRARGLSNSYEPEGQDIQEKGMSSDEMSRLLKGHKYSKQELLDMSKKSTKEGRHGEADALYKEFAKEEAGDGYIGPTNIPWPGSSAETRRRTDERRRAGGTSTTGRDLVQGTQAIQRLRTQGSSNRSTAAALKLLNQSTELDGEHIEEKAVSRAQQRFFGMVRAAQKGEMDSPSAEVSKAASSMSKSDVKDFAKTKHDKLPEKKETKEEVSLVDKILEEVLNEAPKGTIPGGKSKAKKYKAVAKQSKLAAAVNKAMRDDSEPESAPAPKKKTEKQRKEEAKKEVKSKNTATERAARTSAAGRVKAARIKKEAEREKEAARTERQRERFAREDERRKEAARERQEKLETSYREKRVKAAQQQSDKEEARKQKTKDEIKGSLKDAAKSIKFPSAVSDKEKGSTGKTVDQYGSMIGSVVGAVGKAGRGVIAAKMKERKEKKKEEKRKERHEKIRSEMSKESFSNWREEFIFEVDDQSVKEPQQKVIDVTKKKNKIEINPNMSEENIQEIAPLIGILARVAGGAATRGIAARGAGVAARGALQKKAVDIAAQKGGEMTADMVQKRLEKKFKNEDEELEEGAAWTKKEGKSEAGGLNEKGRKSYERENPGSDLKAPSKKVGNPRRASFCARMSGMKAKLTSKKTANDPDSRINKSLRAWNC